MQEEFALADQQAYALGLPSMGEITDPQSDANVTPTNIGKKRTHIRERAPSHITIPGNMNMLGGDPLCSQSSGNDDHLSRYLNFAEEKSAFNNFAYF